MPREQRPDQTGISFLVRKDVHRTLKRKAEENEMSLAEYLVFCGMKAEIKVTVEPDK